jgi:hypothetical protein
MDGALGRGQVLSWLRVLAGELLNRDHLLTARAVASGAQATTRPGAIGAPLLGQVSGLAVGALIDGALQS